MQWAETKVKWCRLTCHHQPLYLCIQPDYMLAVYSRNAQAKLNTALCKGSFIRSTLGQLSLASLLESGVAKSTTSFGWGKGGNATSVGWQVTLRTPTWHVSSSSGEACCKLLHSVNVLLPSQKRNKRTVVKELQCFSICSAGIHFILTHCKLR